MCEECEKKFASMPKKDFETMNAVDESMAALAEVLMKNLDPSTAKVTISFDVEGMEFPPEVKAMMDGVTKDLNIGVALAYAAAYYTASKMTSKGMAPVLFDAMMKSLDNGFDYGVAANNHKLGGIVH